MTPNRRRLISTTAIGGLVLLNLALGLFLSHINAEALLGMAPIAILVQVAQYRMIGSWGRRHSFLKGFVWSSWPVAISFLWGMTHPGVINGGGAPRMRTGSFLWTIWAGYGNLSFKGLGLLLVNPGAGPDPRGNPLKVALRSVVWTSPSPLIGALGGLLYQTWDEGPGPPGRGRSRSTSSFTERCIEK